MLNLAQDALEQAGFSVARIDGQKSLLDRVRAISNFREDPECTIMLASIGSAGEGSVASTQVQLCLTFSLTLSFNSIDLTSANCVHLLEPHWNPMAEAQAVDRVHRIGQSRPVKATRYVTRKSVETVSLNTLFPILLLCLLLTEGQYVQWVQNQKLQLINQSLAVGIGEETQMDVDGERWRVSSNLMRA